jgi:DNA-binding transcriptional MocR family regulator
MLAAALREEIADGSLPVGSFLPSSKALAGERGVGVGIARHALTVLAEQHHVEVVPGLGFRVVDIASHEESRETVPELEADGPGGATGRSQLELLDLVVRHRGEILTRFSSAADPNSAADLHDLLVGAIRRAEVMRSASPSTRWSFGEPAGRH